MLYFAFITIFSAFIVSDLRRIHNRKGDCCGLCCCKYDSVLCCRGHFLSSRQREFLSPESKDKEPEESQGKLDRIQVEKKEQGPPLYSSSAERIIADVFAPSILSKQGRITILVSWAILAVWAIYGMAQLKSTFSMEFFIPKGTYTDAFHQLDVKYFGTGIRVTTIVENTDFDFSSEEAQYQLLDFYDKMYRSYLCDEVWFTEWTLDSWYVKYLYWVSAGQCSAMPDGLPGF